MSRPSHFSFRRHVVKVDYLLKKKLLKVLLLCASYPVIPVLLLHLLLRHSMPYHDPDDSRVVGAARLEERQRRRAVRRRRALRVREHIIRRVEGVVRHDAPTVFQVLEVNFFELIVVFLLSLVVFVVLVARAQVVLVRVGRRLLGYGRVDLGEVPPDFLLLLELPDPDGRCASSIPVVRDKHHLAPEPRALSSGQSAALHAGRGHGTGCLY